MRKKHSKATDFILAHDPEDYYTSPANNFKVTIDKPGLFHCLQHLDVPPQSPSNHWSPVSQGQLDETGERATANFHSCVQDLTSLSLANDDNLSVRFIEHFFSTGDIVTEIFCQSCLLEEWYEFTQKYETMKKNEAFAFMAIVYGIMSISLLHCWSLETLAPGGILVDDRLIYRSLELCSACLDSCNLNEAGRYKVEAATIHLTADLYIKFNLQKAYTAVGQVLALVESSGYTELSQICVGKAGRRQETRLYLHHCKYYVSFYHGKVQTIAPKQSQSWTLDSSILGEHIHCPVRPYLHSTLSCINQLEETATDIGLRLFQEANVTTETLLDFDNQLEEVYKLQLQSLVGYLVETFRTRQMVRVVYHAARLVSHRWTLLGDNIRRPDAICSSSRQKCLQSAMEILAIQMDLDDQRKSHNPWMPGPLILCDFLLAQTVLRLELSYLVHVHDAAQASGEYRQIYYPSTTIAQVLRDSLRVWEKRNMMSVPLHTYVVCQDTLSVLNYHDRKLVIEKSREEPISVIVPDQPWQTHKLIIFRITSDRTS